MRRSRRWKRLRVTWPWRPVSTPRRASNDKPGKTMPAWTQFRDAARARRDAARARVRPRSWPRSPRPIACAADRLRRA